MALRSSYGDIFHFSFTTFGFDLPATTASGYKVFGAEDTSGWQQFSA